MSLVNDVLLALSMMKQQKQSNRKDRRTRLKSPKIEFDLKLIGNDDEAKEQNGFNKILSFLQGLGG